MKLPPGCFAQPIQFSAGWHNCLRCGNFQHSPPCCVDPTLHAERLARSATQPWWHPLDRSDPQREGPEWEQMDRPAQREELLTLSREELADLVLEAQGDAQRWEDRYRRLRQAMRRL